MKVICLVRGRDRRATCRASIGRAKSCSRDRPSTFACSRNPNTRNFWLGLVEDYLRSYDVDGLMWGSERQGPLGNVLVTNHGGAGAGGRLACFCQYCIEAAKKEGINVDRAKAGYTQLDDVGARSSVRARRSRPTARSSPSGACS